MKYLRFGIALGVLYPVTWASILLGGWWLLLAPAVIFGGHLLVDNFTPPDDDTYTDLKPNRADLLLYAHAPWGALTFLLMLWQAAPGDMLGIGNWLGTWLGPWVMEAHGRYNAVQFLACAYDGGLMLSTNTIVAHELVHRRDQPVALAVGRWLLALNGDAQFSISHVYGHHYNVGTAADPATARRGESLYRFVVRSAVGQYIEAVDLERRRLKRSGREFWTSRNHLIHSALMSALIALASYALAGPMGVMMYVLSSLVVKFLFETVNYIQHYGLVRIPAQRVESRHSWDCRTKASTWVFYNLPRHSLHHRKAILPYWELAPIDATTASPRLDYGYIAAMLLAAIPPLWFRWTTPRLLDWDRHLASEEERALARAANQQSNYPPLVAAAS